MPKGKKDGDKLAGKKTPSKKPAAKATKKSAAAPAKKTREPSTLPRMNKAAVEEKMGEASAILRVAGPTGILCGAVAEKLGLPRQHTLRVLKALAAAGKATKPTTTGKGALWKSAA